MCDTTKTTTNCQKHLKKHHPSEFEKAEGNIQSESESVATTDDEIDENGGWNVHIIFIILI